MQIGVITSNNPQKRYKILETYDNKPKLLKINPLNLLMHQKLIFFLASYPFQDDDPFVLNSCPHILLVGSQPKFETAVIEGPEDQFVRLISIPKFSETGQLVLIDTETLEPSVIKIEVS